MANGVPEYVARGKRLLTELDEDIAYAERRLKQFDYTRKPDEGPYADPSKVIWVTRKSQLNFVRNSILRYFPEFQKESENEEQQKLTQCLLL